MEAANKGYDKAQYRLGFIYKNGLGIGLGVEKDLEKGLYWYKKAASQGHCKSQYSLRFCYINGIGIHKDTKKGVKLYIKSNPQKKAMLRLNML